MIEGVYVVVIKVSMVIDELVKCIVIKLFVVFVFGVKIGVK